MTDSNIVTDDQLVVGVSTDHFTQVRNFNFDVLKVDQRKLGFQDQDEFDLTVKQLTEELEEICTAFADQDFIGIIDGAIDLEYFLLGFLYKMGLTAEMYHETFTAINDCNTKKVMGIKAGREGYAAADAIKPENWVSPEEKIASILEKYRV